MAHIIHFPTEARMKSAGKTHQEKNAVRKNDEMNAEEKRRQSENDYATRRWQRFLDDEKLKKYSDRERLAKNLNKLMQRHGVQKRRLGKLVDGGAKELYRLIDEGQERGKYRFRPHMKGYRQVIEAIHQLTGKNLYYLATEASSGLSIDPAGERDLSAEDEVLESLQALAMRLDAEYELLRSFKDTATSRVRQLKSGGHLNWPSKNLDRDAPLKKEDFDEYYTFWPKDEGRNFGLEFTIECNAWYEVLASLPHTYLGLDGDFDFDPDYWPKPPGDEETDKNVVGFCRESVSPWRKQNHQYVNSLFKEPLAISWEKVEDRFRSRFLDGRSIESVDYTLLEARKKILGHIGDEIESDQTSYIQTAWLALYPNREGTAIIPALLWCGYRQDEIEVVPLTVKELSLLQERVLLAEGTVVSAFDRIRQLLGYNVEGFPLEDEWRRTSAFVRFNPFLQELDAQKAREEVFRNKQAQLRKRLREERATQEMPESKPK